MSSQDGIRAEGVSQGCTEGHREEGHPRTKRGRVGNVRSMFGVPHRPTGMWCVWRAEWQKKLSRACRVCVLWPEGSEAQSRQGAEYTREWRAEV